MNDPFQTNAQTGHETSTSGILEEAFRLRRSNRETATHFVLCKGAKLRFLIHLNGGYPFLKRTVTSYGGKMSLFLKLLHYIPYPLLAKCGFGYYAHAELHPGIADCVPDEHNWNALIGTYSDRQKIVFQCFPRSGKTPGIYIKVGNERSEEQMQTEIRFLQQHGDYRHIALPKLLNAKLRSGDFPFNVLVTEEFSGEKVPPVLTPEIYALYRELSAESITIGNQQLVRSHGDFAPWNIRRQGDRHMLFDWEFCGWRPRGYDLVHFLTIVGMNLQHKTFSDAYDEALSVVHTYEPDITMDKEAFYREFTKLMQF